MTESAAAQVVYLNGRFLPRSEASLDIEDRGVLFADGVYEVLRYCGGRPFAMKEHLARLRRSLQAIGIAEPAYVADLPQISGRLVQDNALPDARIYWQITRGAGPRHYTVDADVRPTVLALAYPEPPLDRPAPPPQFTAITLPDRRWHRNDIKTLMLLPGVLDLRTARQAGADTAIWHRDGVVTEAIAANLFIARGGELWTHPADHAILPGITRTVLLQLARKLSVPVVEQGFLLEHLRTADEVMITGTTTHVTAIVRVDGRSVGQGDVGPMTRQLHEALTAHVAEACGL